MKQERVLDKISAVILYIGILVILFPMYLTVVTAFKTPAESAQNFFALPSSLYLENFKEVIYSNNFFVYVKNSFTITIVSIVLILLVVPITAYAIARNMDKLYYKSIYNLFSLGIFIPFQVIMLPVTKLMTSLSLLDKTGLIILYLTFALPQGVFLYVGYIRTSVPVDLEESAYIDGCSKLRTYISIIFPMLKPMTATIIIMNALWIWNDFQLPLLILNRSASYWTLPLFQYNFKSQYVFEYNLAFASFVLSIIPILIVYMVFQKHIIDGLTSGAVKG